MGMIYNNIIGGGSWKQVYSRSINQISGTFVFDNITFSNLRNYNLSGNVYIVGSWEYNGVGNDGMYNATFFPKGYLSSHFTYATGATIAGCSGTTGYFWARSSDIVYYANPYTGSGGSTATLVVYVQEE